MSYRTTTLAFIFAIIMGKFFFGVSLTAADDPSNSLTEKSRPPFIFGGDISWVQEQEDQGVKFSDEGEDKDIFVILKEHRFNAIRLRLFNNPQEKKGYSKKGYCDLAHTLAMAKRIKAAGMSFLLDFHYSDTWADPQKQFKPAAWKDLHGDELQKAVCDYTKEVLSSFKRQGTPPDMVQIGNEVNNGLLWPDGEIEKTGDWKTFCGLLKAGIKGAKEADPAVKIMVHIACGGDNKRSRELLDQMQNDGVAFDVIGQSYYPRWHGTLNDLKNNLTDLAGRYKQGIILVEYAAPNLREINDIVHGLPNGKGLGAYFWEPTKGGPGGPGVFDWKGKTKPDIDIYPTLAKEYAAPATTRED